MQLFPTSALSSTPAARLADVQDLVGAGFINKEDALSLLDFPDLESSMNLLNADNKNLERIIEKMMDEGEYFPPEPYQNLENCLRKTQQAYLMYKTQGAPDDRLELLRQFMEDCQNLLLRAREEVPGPQELTQELAEAGAATAAAEVAENIPQEQDLLASGAIDLGVPDEEGIVPQEEVITEEQIVEEQL